MSSEPLAARSSAAEQQARRGAPIIELAGVGKIFGSGEQTVHALGPLDLAIEAGSFVSIIGPSGCGKSTLLRLIAGLETPTQGQLRRNGAVLDGPSREVGVVFQDHVLFPWATILDNVMLPADVMGLPRQSSPGTRPLASRTDWVEGFRPPPARHAVRRDEAARRFLPRLAG